MKRLILFTFLVLSLNSYANCQKAYSDAALYRSRVHTVVAMAASGFTIVGSAGTVPALTALGLSGFAYSFTLPGDGETYGLKNRFGRAHGAIKAIIDYAHNKKAEKIYEKVLRKTAMEDTYSNRDLIRLLVEKAYGDMSFCPITKIRNDGSTIRKPFSAAKIIDYLQAELGSKVNDSSN